MSERERHSVVCEVDRSLRHAGIGRDRMLVACSGGPDSTALLCALAELRTTWKFEIAAGYFDHGLRGRNETKLELELLRDICRRLGVELHVSRIDPGVIHRIASIARRGIEDACREERYGFLNRTMRDGGFTRIVLGHTKSDQAETVIQRLFEGSGPGGMAAISADNPPLLRPLINVERSEIVDFLDSISVKYSIDSSNTDSRFLRNRIRNELIPIIHDIFPGYLRGVVTQAEKATLSDSYLRDEADTRIPLSTEGDSQAVSIDRENFYRAPPILRLYAIYAAMNRIGGFDDLRADRVPYRAIRSWAFVEDDGVRESRVLLRTKSREIERTKSRIVIRSRVVFDREKSYLLIVHEPGEYELVGKMCLLISEKKLEPPDVLEICISEFPVVFRSYQTADAITSRGHERRVSELMSGIGDIDQKKTMVIEDRAGIVAAISEKETVVRDSAGFSRRLYARIIHVKDEGFGYERTGKVEQSRR